MFVNQDLKYIFFHFLIAIYYPHLSQMVINSDLENRKSFSIKN